MCAKFGSVAYQITLERSETFILRCQSVQDTCVERRALRNVVRVRFRDLCNLGVRGVGDICLSYVGIELGVCRNVEVGQREETRAVLKSVGHIVNHYNTTHVPSSSQSPVTNGMFATLPEETSWNGGAVRNTPSTRGSHASCRDWYAKIIGVLLIAAERLAHETVRRHARVSAADEHPTWLTIWS